MKNFFKMIGESFYSSELYKKVKDEEISNGIIFLLKVSVFLGLALGVIALIVFLIFAGTLKKIAVNFVEKSYPESLIVTVKEGNLTANTTEPVVVPSPFKKEEGIPNNLTVLVPNEKTDPSVLEKYNTMSAITSNGIISMKNNQDSSQFQIYGYKKANQIITKGSAMDTAYFVLHFFKILIAIIVIPTIVLLVLLLSLSHMIFLFFVSLLIFLIMKIKKLEITYKQSYKMGVYALVPLILLEVLASPLNLSGRLFTIVVILAIILYSTHTWKKEEPVNIEESLHSL